jgi:hypothetical protein
MQNAAVFITIESVLAISFCLEELKALFDTRKRKWIIRLLSWYPGLLIFPVLFYLQTQLIFAMTGVDFSTVSFLFAGTVLIALPVSSMLLRRLCPEKEVQLEVYFLVNLFICAIGLIATVNGNTTYTPVREQVNVNAVILSLAIFIFAFITGFLINKYKWIIKRKFK